MKKKYDADTEAAYKKYKAEIEAANIKYDKDIQEANKKYKDLENASKTELQQL